MPLPPALSKAITAYLFALRLIAGVSMAVIVVVMIAQVWARYVLGGSLIWAEELCRYLLMWQTFLMVGLAYSRGEFVAIDFLPASLSARGKRNLKAISAIPIVVFLVLITDAAADYASRFSNQTIPALDFIWDALFGRPLGLSIKYVYFSVAAGCGLMVLHVIADVIHSFAVKPADADAPQNVSDTAHTGDHN